METKALTMFHKTIKSDLEERIFIQPICDFFKIDGLNQLKRIKSDPILSKCQGKNTDKSLFGDNYPRVSLDKKGFVRWIQILNPNIIDEQLRPSFLIYQELVFDYLMGSQEEQRMIANLNATLQNLKNEYSRIGIEIRTTQKQLFEALNNRYQYALPFGEQKQLQ